MATNIGPKIGIDGEAEYRKQINNIIQQAKTLDSEMKAVTASFTKDTTAKEKNAATSKILSEQISVQKKRIEELSGMLEKSAKKYGENDTRTLKWKEAVNNATAELKRLEAQQRDSADATDELGDAMDDAGKKSVSFGDILKANVLSDAIMNGYKALAGAIKNVASEIINLDKTTEEYRIAMGKLNTAYEAAGYSTDTAQESYREFYGILGDTDTAVEASQLLAKLAVDEKDMATWTDIAAGVWGTFGDALPIEGLIESANETARVGKVTGNLADALNWASINEDDFNEKLADCTTETERNRLIMDTLAGTYDEASDAFYRNNKELVKSRENQASLDAVTGDLGQTVSDVKNTLTAELMPVIQQVLEGFNAWAQSVDWDAVSQKAGDFIQFVIDNGPAIISTIGVIVAALAGFKIIATITTAVQGLSAAFAFLAANPIVLVIAAIAAFVAAIAVFGDEIQAVLQKVDDFLQNVFAMDFKEIFGPVLGEYLNAFMANVKNIWDSIKRVFDGIIDFIRGVFTGDWERAWEGIKNIFGGIFDSLVAIAKAPLNGIIGLLNLVINGVNWLIDGINEISFEVPDWVPGIGGKQLGFNLPHRSNIPYMAKGGILSSGSAIVGEKGAELLTIVNGKARVTPLTGANAFKGIQSTAYLPQAPGVTYSQASSTFSPTIQIKINATDAESFERSGVTDAMVEAISEKLGMWADRRLRSLGVNS